MAEIVLPQALQNLVVDEPSTPHHLVPKTGEEWKTLVSEQAEDKARDALVEHGLKGPALEMAKELGHYIKQEGASLLAEGASSGATVVRAGELAGTAAEAYESATALISAVSTGAGVAAIGLVGEFKALNFIDEHSNHALSDNPVARAGQHLTEKTGLPERVDYANGVLDAFEDSHPDASRAKAATVWAGALVDSHILDNHAASLQKFFNESMAQAGHPEHALSLAEARVLVPVLEHAQKGDAIVVSGANILYEHGPVRSLLGPGELAIDATALHEAAQVFHREAGNPPHGNVVVAANSAPQRDMER